MRVVAALLLLTVLAPSAAAFRTSQETLHVAYAADEPPAVVATGALSLEGALSTGLMLAGSTTTRLEDIPHLTLVERSSNGPQETELRDVTLEVSRGGLLWEIPTGATLPIQLSAAYGIGLGLPEAPIPSETGETGAGFLLASESVTGAASWPGGVADLAPFDAVITLRDAGGTPYPGWESRAVNQGAGSQSDPERLGVAFRAEGTFTARIGAELVGGVTVAPGSATLHTSPAAEDRFRQTAERLSETTSQFFGDENPFVEEGDPLEVLGQASGILNGALIIVPGGVGEGVEAIAPLESRYGDDPFDLGPISIVRGDMDLAWSDGQMLIEGEPTVVLGRNGFETEAPLTVGLFPVVSLVLWAGAVAALVYYFVKRPPTGAPTWSLRLLSWAFALVMLLAVFWLWDRSFEQTFGTGVLSTIRAQGITPDSLPTIGVLLALELVPWGIAGLLFALPVRIGLGVALRYLGKGKSFKGLATGGGLLALGLLGPAYALWCFNLVWARAASMIGT